MPFSGLLAAFAVTRMRHSSFFPGRFLDSELRLGTKREGTLSRDPWRVPLCRWPLIEGLPSILRPISFRVLGLLFRGLGL